MRQIQLTPGEAKQFEQRFGGKMIFMNTGSNWLVDDHDRSAVPTPENSILFTVPAP